MNTHNKGNQQCIKIMSFLIFIAITAITSKSSARLLNAEDFKVLRQLDAFKAAVERETPGDRALIIGIQDLRTDVIGMVLSESPEVPQSPESAAIQWALRVWANEPARYAHAAAITIPSGIASVKAGKYKCNRFVADAFGIGACKGFATDGENGAYPVTARKFLFWGGHNPPMANQLADQNLLLANLYVIHESEARPGNIVAYPGGKDLGHTGILLGHNLYISARDDEDHQTRPAKSFQVVDGIQIKMLDPGTKTFRRFSYGFEFEFEFANYLESRRFYIPGNRFQVTVNAHYKTTVDHSTTDYLQVSLVRMSDGDHSECNLQVGGKVTCSWRKQQPGAYYMILKKAPISGRLVTADILEGNGEVTANGN